jgi:hypothetical protein
MWKNLEKVSIDDSNGLIVIADDLTHAYGLLTRDEDISNDSDAFWKKPYVAVDIPKRSVEVIPFISLLD